MSARMKRRTFITLLGAAAFPLLARAEQLERMRHIGVLTSQPESDPDNEIRHTAARDELARTVWVVGRNLRLDYRYADARPALMQSFAAELVKLKPDLIFANSTPVLEALLKQTRSLPIIFTGVSDPVSAGYVPNLAKPGGNITGFSNFEYSIGGKWLQLLKEAAPDLTRVGVLVWQGDQSWTRYLAPIEALAPTLGIEVTRIFLGEPAEFEREIAAFARNAGTRLLVT